MRCSRLSGPGRAPCGGLVRVGHTDTSRSDVMRDQRLNHPASSTMLAVGAKPQCDPDLGRIVDGEAFALGVGNETRPSRTQVPMYFHARDVANHAAPQRKRSSSFWDRWLLTWPGAPGHAQFPHLLPSESQRPGSLPATSWPDRNEGSWAASRSVKTGSAPRRGSGLRSLPTGTGSAPRRAPRLGSRSSRHRRAPRRPESGCRRQPSAYASRAGPAR